MSKIRTTNKKLIALVLMTSIVVALLFAMLVFAPHSDGVSDALTTANMSNAYKVGTSQNGSTLTEAWNSTEQEFDSEVMEDLLNALAPSGQDLEEWMNAQSANAQGDKVADASKIKANSGKAQGVVVRIGGIDWMVVYLTSTKIDNVDTVVATLYAANPIATCQFHSSNVPDYVKATIRKTIENNSSLALFKDNTESNEDFSDLYIVKPKHIGWQRTGQKARPEFTNYQSTAENHGGSGWADDTVWLPSQYEVNSLSGAYETADGLWKLTTEQKGFDSTPNSFSWLRSAYSGTIAFNVSLSGTPDYYDASSTRGLRPALHLNLTSAALGAAGRAKNPEDVSTTYDGSNQTIDTLLTAGKTIDWYSNDYTIKYDATITYYTTEGVAVTPKDAGTYWGKVEIDSTSDKKFKGDANNSISYPGGVPEGDKVRWFKFTINPKEINVTAPSYSNGTLTMPTMNSSDFIGSTGLPYLAVKITGTLASGTFTPVIAISADEFANIKFKRGNYTVSAVFINSATDKTEYAGNYKIKTTASCAFSVDRAKIGLVSSTSGTAEYTGSNLEFALTGYSSAWAEDAILAPATGVTLEGNDTDGWKLVVVDEGEYEIVLSLKDRDNFCWAVAGDPVTNQSFKIKVTPKPLTVIFNSSTGGFEFDAGSSAGITVDDDSVSEDNVVLTLTYYNKSTPANVIAVSGNRLDCSTLDVGEYMLVVTLIRTNTASDNKNYIITAGNATKEFKINSKEVSVDSLPWQVSQLGGTPTEISVSGNSASNPYERTYNGKPYDFAVYGALPHGVQFDTSAAATSAGFSGGYKNVAQTNATSSAVAVMVRIAPTTGHEFRDAGGNRATNQYKEFTLYVKIKQALYDLTGAKWDYDTFEYDGNLHTVSVIDLPNGLTIATADYTNNSNRNVANYNASFLRFTNADTTNYVTPVSSNASSYEGTFEFTHAWEITPKEIPLIWETPDFTNSAGKTFGLPKIKDYNDTIIKYTYQSADESFNPTGTIASASAIEEVEGSVKRYLVTAGLTTAASTNYRLSTDGENPYRLSLGQNKDRVTVSLKSNETTYNADEQPVELEISIVELTESDFSVKYYLASDTAFANPLADVPKNAGSYKVKVTLTGRTNWYYLDGTDTFSYTINKASLSLDGVKWNYTEPLKFKFEEGEAQVQEIYLIDSAGNRLDEELYHITYTNNTSSMVGTKTATVTFGVDTTNYEPLNTSRVNALKNITWKIDPHTLSIPQVEDREFRYDNQEHSLLDFITLDDDWRQYVDVSFTLDGATITDIMSDAGEYQIKFTLKSALGGNVEWEGEDSMPKNITISVKPYEVTLNGWSDGKPPRPDMGYSDSQYYVIYYTDELGSEVSVSDMQPNVLYYARVKIADGLRPQNVKLVQAENVNDYKEFKMFAIDGNTHKIALPTSVKASVEYNRQPYTFRWTDFGGDAEDLPYLVFSGTRTLTNVGTGTLIISIKGTENAVWADNTTADRTFSVEIVKGRIAPNWNTAYPPTLDVTGEKAQVVEYKYYTLEGEEVTDGLFNMNDKYIVRASILPEYKHIYGFYVDDTYIYEIQSEFTATPLQPVKVPTIKNDTLTFDGDAHTFELEFEGNDADYIDIIGSLTQTNANTYSITLRLKSGAIWADGSTGDQILHFTINRQKLNPAWTMASGVPKLDLGSLPVSAVTYAYFDENGVETTTLSKGGKYSVVARLTAGYVQNYGFGDNLAYETFAYEFISPEDITTSGIPIVVEEEMPMPIWQLIVAVACILLSMLMIGLCVKYSGMKKKADGETAKANAKAYVAIPVISSTATLFGWSMTIWSIIAFATIGLFVVCTIAMLIMRSRCNKAIQAKELAIENAEARKEEAQLRKEEAEKRERKEREERAEQLRLEREERERRERIEREEKAEQRRIEREEQAERERRQSTEQMQMMLASLMNTVNTRPVSANETDTRQIVAEVIQQLMPAFQEPLQLGYSSAQPIYEHSSSDMAYEGADETDDEWDEYVDDDEDFFDAEAYEPEPAYMPPKKLSTNFRVRVKETSDKNRETYCMIKNAFCAQKGVAYRVCGRLEKIKYHGDIIAMIGIAKRSIKLWLALDPNEFDVNRYYHKDYSDKARFKDVPLLIYVGSDRARKRAMELLSALFAKFGIDARRKYEDRGVQELIYTLKGNRVLKFKEPQLLREVVHVDDTKVISGAFAEACLETKETTPIANEMFETVDLQILADNFTDGQKVTLDKLIKKGIVPSGCNGFRVTASERLSKPLIVYANEFSVDAVKMIIVTGGRAIQLVPTL